jgi:3-oxoacyl-(acyl-carrier-protein) synthase
MRRRLEVATAMAWEALTDTHSRESLNFIDLMNGRLTFEEALVRYLREMDMNETVASAVRTRALVALEDRPAAQPKLQLHDEAGVELVAEEEDDEGWRRFRPDVMVRGVFERQKRNEETDRWIELAIARAEEAVIKTHIDNAITFAALLDDHAPMGRAVQAYIGSVQLTGGRSQSVFQRTMAKLAEVHLPSPTQREDAKEPGSS